MAHYKNFIHPFGTSFYPRFFVFTLLEIASSSELKAKQLLFSVPAQVLYFVQLCWGFFFQGKMSVIYPSALSVKCSYNCGFISTLMECFRKTTCQSRTHI